ncbi:hypothetical protein [Amycolatopsis sp. NBC_01480]|uniref:hypothetical protein n=1 Tax=Amycolatopsis sp. NBC_01480 TaxID=2903562 RepID=UPI002E2ABDFF|nr:hypothetical protein [Amycolatopsis sp. NBC_01480]
MTTIDDFIGLLNTELGMAWTADDLDVHLDQLPEWNSLHLLSVLTRLEQYTGHEVSLPDALVAGSLRDLYGVATAR